MGALIPLAIQLVPEIAKLFLGSGSDTVAGKVEDIAMKVFGTNKADEIKAQMDADAAKADAFKAMVQALAASDAAQNNVNDSEAKSGSMFMAGWRPAAGWVCVSGLAYQYLAFPFVSWICMNLHLQTPPSLDMATLMQLLLGMLGLGTLRFLDKTNGVETKQITKPSFKLFK